MTLTLNLSPELEERLRRAAEAAGVAETDFVIRTLEQRLKNERQQSLFEMLRHWRAEDETTDPAEIEERRRSWEAFKAGMNEDHSSGRKLFP